MEEGTSNNDVWAQWIGHYLGRYYIEAVIGQGGMGMVFLAQDPELRRAVALKVLYPQLVADNQVLERFRREARTAAGLSHRNIVGIYDVGQEEGRYFLVMEYLEGHPLSAIIEEQGPLPVHTVIDITTQIASALDCIHEQNLVHRDVKTGNIIVAPDGRAVITDFGLVRALAGSKLTTDGTIVGTPQYMAPERVSGGKIGPWTDLYALGIVTYEMITGQVPFDADEPSALFTQVLWEPPPSIVSARPGVPEAVDRVLERVLAKEPHSRHSSGAAFVAELETALLRGIAPAAPAAGGTTEGRPAAKAPSIRPTRVLQPSDRPRQGWSFPPWAWAALGGFVVLVIAGVGFLFGRLASSSPPTPTNTPTAVAATPTDTALPTPTPPAATETPTSEPTATQTARPTQPTQPPATTQSIPTTAAPSRTQPVAVPTQLPTQTRPPQPTPTMTQSPTPTETPPPPTEQPPTAKPTMTPSPTPTATPQTPTVTPTSTAVPAATMPTHTPVSSP